MKQMFFCMCFSKAHILLDGVRDVEAKHPLTDDHSLQLDTTSLGKIEHFMDNLMFGYVYIQRNIHTVLLK